MKLTLPADYTSAISEVGGIAALLDKNGWKAAAFIAVAVKPRAGQGGGTSTTSGQSFTRFAKDLNAKGWSKTVVQRHYEAWEKAADAGLVTHAADLVYGEKIEVPTDNWATYYPPSEASWTDVEDADAIREQGVLEGAGTGAMAVKIAANPKSLTAAIKASPKVAKAAAQALVDAGDIETLSKATAAVAKNRQVDRNRKRATEGSKKSSSVQNPAPQVSPEVKAFMSMHGLSDALRALVTTFPNEWANLPDEARTEDIIALCEESFDKLEIALANARAIVHGVSDADLQDLLNGGVA